MALWAFESPIMDDRRLIDIPWPEFRELLVTSGI
jgi:hypothetical protein